MVIGFMIFALMPSNPVAALTRGRPNMDPKQMALLIHQLGLNDPVWLRFWHFVANTLPGQAGLLVAVPNPGLDARRAAALADDPADGQLDPAVHRARHVAGHPQRLAPWQPARPARYRDFAHACGRCRPSGSASSCSCCFASGFGPIPPLFPAGGMSTPGTPGGLNPAHIVDVLRHLFLPCLTLVLVVFAQYVTIMRSSIIDELGAPYLLTARAKGLRDAEVRRKHVVPNAMLPSVTVIFLQIGSLISGAITVETVYSWPGLGYLTFQALQIPDLPLLEGTFVLFGASVIVFNLLADLLYRYLDPRVRRQ